MHNSDESKNIHDDSNRQGWLLENAARATGWGIASAQRAGSNANADYWFACAERWSLLAFECAGVELPQEWLAAVENVF